MRPWLAVGLLSIAAAGMLVSRPGGMRRTPDIAAPAHPAATASLEAANERAVALVLEGRAVESLPWFRRQFALMTDRIWGAHVDFAAALHNAAVESGATGPHTRSSLERVALVREALHELDVAESLATAPADRVRVCIDRAHTLEFWGMPWDALGQVERAAAVPGAGADVAVRAARARGMLHLPGGPPSFSERVRG